MTNTLVHNCAACGKTHWIDFKSTDEGLCGFVRKQELWYM